MFNDGKGARKFYGEEKREQTAHYNYSHFGCQVRGWEFWKK